MDSAMTSHAQKSPLATPILAESVPASESAPSTNETRLNVRLAPEARDAVDWIATQRGVSNVEAIRRAIGTEKFFLELAQRKAKIFVEVPGEKNLKEVVFI
jgi:hypothetical protein